MKSVPRKGCSVSSLFFNIVLEVKVTTIKEDIKETTSGSKAKLSLFISTPPYLDFPRSTGVKNLPASAGDMGSIPGLAGSPGVGNSNSLQYSCLENSMDRET